MVAFTVVPWIGATADSVDNIGKAQGSAGLKLKVTDADSDVTLTATATGRTQAGSLSDVSFKGVDVVLEKEDAFTFALSAPHSGTPSLKTTLHCSAKLSGKDVALKYTQTAGKDDGCVSGKFKVADDTEATVAYDLDGFNGLDVNKFSGVLKYKYDDGCDASISYHARDKRSVLRVTHKIDSVNKLEASANLNLNGGDVFQGATVSLTNKSDTLGKGKAQLDATISASGKVGVFAKKEWDIDL